METTQVSVIGSGHTNASLQSRLEAREFRAADELLPPTGSIRFQPRAVMEEAAF
jgi:hypothetical protein